MLAESSVVRVLAPFNVDFPGTYTVTEISSAEDGQMVVFLDGVDSAFSPDYLEAVE